VRQKQDGRRRRRRLDDVLPRRAQGGGRLRNGLHLQLSGGGRAIFAVDLVNVATRRVHEILAARNNEKITQ